jgi:CubicO group peptidase (beta-lactamase class C family)
MYLEGFAAGTPGKPITLFDILTHTAGLDDQFVGYLARKESDVRSLGEHLREHLPQPFQPPGTEINYSNYAYALAGHVVERVSGMKFTAYVNQEIFTPLGMTRTTYSLPDNYQDLPAYAHGYKIRESFENVISYPRHVTPAGSALSCVSDMKRLLQEFLRPSGKILSDSSLAKLINRQFTSHPLLMGYTLGMEEQHINGYRGVGKGGSFTGFISEFVVFPDQQLGLFVTTNTQTDNFLEVFGKELLRKVLPPRSAKVIPAIQIDLNEFAGTYRSERYNHHTVEDLLSLYQGKFELTVSPEGDLVTYHNGATQHYQAIDSLIFQNTKITDEYLVFKRGPLGNISRLYRDVNLAGFYVPVSLSPVAWYDDPVLINEYYFLILAFIVTLIAIPIFRGWVLLRRRWKPDYWKRGLVPAVYLYPAFVVMIMYIIQVIGGFFYFIRNLNNFYFGVPDSFRLVQQITYSFPLLLIILVVMAFRLWKNHEGVLAFRIYYSLVTISALIHFAFLYRWHFIGVHV